MRSNGFSKFAEKTQGLEFSIFGNVTRQVHDTNHVSESAGGELSDLTR